MPSPPSQTIGRLQQPGTSADKPDRSDKVRHRRQSLPPRGEFHDHDLLRHCLQPLHLPVELGVRWKWEDDLGVNALEQALLALRRDADFFEAFESQHPVERRDSLTMESEYHKKASLPTKKSQAKPLAPGDVKPRLQSLAATHPSLYRQPSSDESTRAMPPPELPQKALEVQHVRPDQESQPKVQVNCNRTNLVSTRHRGSEEFNMLETDVDPERPNVNSPIYLISLPFGTLVEVACHYADLSKSE